MTSAAALPLRRSPLSAARLGGAILIVMAAACLLSLPWSLAQYNAQQLDHVLEAPHAGAIMGTDRLGRSLAWRCLLGGAISLGIGLAAATITTLIGTAWGLVAGYVGGRVDAAMMRCVDVLYGLPYILLVVLLNVALQPVVERWLGPLAGNIVTLLIAIGAVSWLTLARVVRGQVLSIKQQPFVEAARAMGCSPLHIMTRHLLPNLLGPIIVYTTLTVPQAILQESFLSFLGIGVQPPLPSWGNLAADGLVELNPVKSHAWLLIWPCVLLGVTLLALNFMGDGLRDYYDPRSRSKR
ncbi:MAG: ABC transporter permease subunit [Planctomycetes bacterium]|nr:ABC transporter permease subunit [Planctomycetota bacterium]